MTENLAGRGERLAEALDLLEKCRPSHFDFSGALVHHEKPNGNELSFDPSCPKCVIPKAITLIRAALEAAAPAGTARKCKFCYGEGSVGQADEGTLAECPYCAQARKLVEAVAKEAVQLAIMRSELTWDADTETTEEEIAEDAVWALFGEGTCSEKPTENTQKLLAALATPSPQAPPEQSNAFSTTSAREQSAATASDRLGVGDIESLAATFHVIYQSEARRQGDVRHKDAYADLPENIKEFDRVLARYVLLNFEVTRIEP